MSGLFAEQASAAATSDRVATADHLLDVACQEAIGILRLGASTGDPWTWADANRVLGIAQHRAHRILGPEAAPRPVPCDRPWRHPAHTYVATARSGVDFPCPGVPA